MDGKSVSSEQTISFPETTPDKNQETWQQWAEVAKTKWFDGLLKVTQGLGVASVAAATFLQRAKIEPSQLPKNTHLSPDLASLHQAWLQWKPIAENLPPIIRDHMGNANDTFLMMSCILPLVELVTNSVGVVPELLFAKSGLNPEKLTKAREKFSQMTPYIFMTLLALHAVDIETTQFIPHQILHIAAGVKDLGDIPAGLAGIWAGLKVYQFGENTIFKQQREKIKETLREMSQQKKEIVNNDNNAALL